MASENVTDSSPLNESSPLLHDQLALEAQKATKPKITPLPKAQLATLCSVRIVDPIAFTQIFPYINEFMNDLHVTDDPSRIGFYSGLVVRLFYSLHCALDILSRKVPLPSPKWLLYTSGLIYLVSLHHCFHFNADIVAPTRRHWSSAGHPCWRHWHRYFVPSLRSLTLSHHSHRHAFCRYVLRYRSLLTH
jgi:hypothetical protein